MDDVPGYHVVRTVYETPRASVLQATRDADGVSVLLKCPVTDHPSSKDLSSYRREEDVLKFLKGQGVGPELLGVERVGHCPVLVMLSNGGRSLQSWVRDGGLQLAEKLQIAQAAARELGKLHGCGLTHKDVSPSKILWSRVDGTVQIIDFELSTTLKQERANERDDRVLHGTLAYIAPEQTGRMNRTVDYRADLYALGATLYHLFVGRPPFEGLTAMEVIHGHVARAPKAAHVVNPAVPRCVSEVLSCLLRKEAAERYQSAAAVAADIARCARLVQEGRDGEPFEVHRLDRVARFSVPERLYGREREVADLERMYLELADHGGRALAKISGVAGAGKTVLAMEVRRTILSDGGLMGVGKFQQLHRGRPYSALVDALTHVADYLLMLSDAELNAWRMRIRASLDSDEGLAVLQEVLPFVERMFGTQPAPPDLDPIEAQRRLQLYVERFIRGVCTHARALVLFLDDLQWADAPSLDLLERLLTDRETQHLMVLGTYRPDEVGPGHPLGAMVNALEKDEVPISVFALGPLPQDGARQLVADALNRPVEEVSAFADGIFHRTEGNAFFVHEVLKALHHGGMLTFEPASEAWIDEPNALARLDLLRGAASLISARLDELDGAARHLVRVASCVGGEFDAGILAWIEGKHVEETLRVLHPAIEAGILLPVRDDVLSAEHAGDGLKAVEVGHLRFFHDRIQRVIFDELDREERQNIHVRIGTRLAETLEYAPEDRIFDAVEHLNDASDALQSAEDHALRRRLNHAAGDLAISKSSYDAALHLYRQGIDTLPEVWDDTVAEVAHRLYVGALTAAYGASNFEAFDECFDAFEARATDPIKLIQAKNWKIMALTLNGRAEEAIDYGLEILRGLGIRIRNHPALWRVALTAMRHRLTETHDPRVYQKMPPMTDPLSLQIMGILRNLTSGTFIGRPMLYPLVQIASLRMVAKHGRHPGFHFATACYGMLLVGPLWLIAGPRRARAYMEVTEEHLSEHERKNPVDPARTMFANNTFLRHWFVPFGDQVAAMRATSQRCLASGENEYAGHAATMEIQFGAQAAGRHLPTLLDEGTASLELFEYRLKNELSQNHMRAELQWVACMMGKAPDKRYLRGEFFSLDGHGDAVRGTGVSEVGVPLFLGYAVYNQLMLSYWFDDVRSWDDQLETLKKFEFGLRSSIHGALMPFWRAIMRLSQARDRTTKVWFPRWRARLEMSWLKRVAKMSPANGDVLVAIVEAESAYTARRYWAAERAYERAIQLARAQGYLQYEGLAARMAARFYMSFRMPERAQQYVRIARYAFEAWGAHALVEHLDAEFGPPQDAARSSSMGDSSSPRLHAGALDVMSMVKANRAISEELEYDRLLAALTAVVVENGGATTGAVILGGPQSPMLHLAALGGADPDQVDVDRERALDGRTHGVPLGVVRATIGTGKLALVHDVEACTDYGLDSFDNPLGSRSIFCLPMVRQGKVVGALYLENNQAREAFSPERVATLEMLVGQAAISLENAQIVDHLEDLVAAKTEELERAQEELLHAAHRAGQADVAQEVMDNIGNFMTSLVAPISLVSGTMHASRVIPHADHLLAALDREDSDERKALESGELGLFKEHIEYLRALIAHDRDVISKHLEVLTSAASKIEEEVSSQERHTHHKVVVGTVRLEELLRDVVQGIEGSHAAAGSRIRLEMAGIAPITSQWHKIAEVCREALMNAVEAVQTVDDARRDVVVRVVQDESTTTIEVCDLGVGIAPDDLPKVLRRAFTTKPNRKGRGLYMAVRAAKDLDAKLEVASPGPDQGTTVRLLLPNYSEGRRRAS